MFDGEIIGQDQCRRGRARLTGIEISVAGIEIESLVRPSLTRPGGGIAKKLERAVVKHYRRPGGRIKRIDGADLQSPVADLRIAREGRSGAGSLGLG